VRAVAYSGLLALPLTARVVCNASQQFQHDRSCATDFNEPSYAISETFRASKCLGDGAKGPKLRLGERLNYVAFEERQARVHYIELLRLTLLAVPVSSTGQRNLPFRAVCSCEPAMPTAWTTLYVRSDTITRR